MRNSQAQLISHGEKLKPDTLYHIVMQCLIQHLQGNSCSALLSLPDGYQKWDNLLAYTNIYLQCVVTELITNCSLDYSFPGTAMRPRMKSNLIQMVTHVYILQVRLQFTVIVLNTAGSNKTLTGSHWHINLLEENKDRRYKRKEKSELILSCGV